MSEHDETVEQEEVAEQEVNETEAAIREAFDVAVSEEKDEDDIKLAMIGAGATFKNVTRLYNKFMIDAGLAISKADRDAIISDTLEGRDFDTEEAFDEAVTALLEAVKGATERSAAALVRGYAKKNELEVYAKPKGTGGSRGGFATDFYAWLAEAPRTKEEATAYVNGDGDYADTSENTKRHISHYMNIWSLADKIRSNA